MFRKSPRFTRMVKNKLDLKCSPHRSRGVRRSLSRLTSSDVANVKVVVRVRPPNEREQGDNSRIIINIVDDNVLIFDPKETSEEFFYHGVPQRGRDLLKKANKNLQFLFDRVFGYECDNDNVFDDSTKDLIKTLMDGYNSSVFVYGATGAGKTHTMLGSNGNPGITFLTMKELFQQMEDLKDEREFELGITYLEVYNETVKDLLNPGGPLHLREDGKFGVCVAGINVQRIKNPEELFALLEKGNRNRTQHPTDANAESSRSHAVFQVYVNMKVRNTGERRIAKLSMIDLAGSERGAATGCKGMRFTEGANINKSLLALGNCINSLADGQRHIPYRDSKLTRLLKDSLGGNCQTVMIANISPSSLNYEDTYNTLKYATRAKKIQSNMKKNVVNSQLTIPQYMKLVEDLNKENASLKEKLKKLETATPSTCCCNSESTTQIVIEDSVGQNKLKIMLKELLTLQKQIQRLRSAEQILELKVKFKESSEALFIEMAADDEHLEAGRNRISNSVGTFQRKTNSILSQLQELEMRKADMESKVAAMLDEAKGPATENLDILHSNIDLNAAKYDIQVEHTNRIIDVYHGELEYKEKLFKRMANVMETYHQLLRGRGLITDEMAEEYRNVERLAQGIRSVSWQDDDEVVLPSSVRSQDSGISSSSATSMPNMPESGRNVNPLIERLNRIDEEYTGKKREAKKRKLDDSDSMSTPSTDSLESETNLNETIVVATSFNADLINNTFCINNKESVRAPKPAPSLPFKKPTYRERNVSITADNFLPKVYKTTTKRFGATNSSPRITSKENNAVRAIQTKNVATVNRNLRFPLRNKAQETVGSSGVTRALNKNSRINTAPAQRFKL